MSFCMADCFFSDLLTSINEIQHVHTSANGTVSQMPFIPAKRGKTKTPIATKNKPLASEIMMDIRALAMAVK